jgi:hypothetical protein
MNNNGQVIRIYDGLIENRPVLGFNTGLNARSFAQARLDSFLSEQGLIVFPDGKVETWKPDGLAEVSGSMVIYGPAFSGEWLDTIVDDKARRDEALNALACWTDAVLSLESWQREGRQTESLQARHWPCAALIVTAEGVGYPQGTVFFVPENLCLRCIKAAGEEGWLQLVEQYAHPDLSGLESAAFCASAMLYRVFSGIKCFAAQDDETLHQDMREGNFLPIRLAAISLNEDVADSIQQSLSQKKGDAMGGNLLRQLQEGIKIATQPPAASSFFRLISDEERHELEKEKTQFQKRKKLSVNVRRFARQNTALILGISAALLLALGLGYSIAKSRAALPNTAGMDSLQVIEAYYSAFNELDHQAMEAIVARGAGKNDVNLVTNFFIITKVRQAYEHSWNHFVPAREWRESGSPELEIPVFGITDLQIRHLSGSEDSEEVRCLAGYTLWLPWSEAEDEQEESGPVGTHYSIELRLARIKGNWRIVEITNTGD